MFWLFCFRSLGDIKQHGSPWHFRVCLHKDTAGEHPRQIFIWLTSFKLNWVAKHVVSQMLKCRILSSSLLRSRASTQEPPALPSVCPQHLGVAAPSTLRLQRVTLRPLTCTSWPPISSHTLRCSTTTCSRTDRWAWAMLPSVYLSGSGNKNPSNFPLSIKAFHVVWILFKNCLINYDY